jgi:hypothetical protein
MKTSVASAVSTPSVSSRFLSTRRHQIRLFGLVGLMGAVSASLLAQDTKAGADAQGGRRRNAAAAEAGAERGERGARGDRGNMTPQDMQARLLTALRERLEVTDDEEWKVISDRVAKVSELRRATGGGAPMFGAFGGRGGPPGGGQGGPAGPGGTGGDARGGRGPGRGPGGSPELAALSTAVRDKLPDAEIKSRLDRLRETRKDSEAKLTKAQEELRAVLSVRQEAVAVVFGLLP